LVERLDAASNCCKLTTMKTTTSTPSLPFELTDPDGLLFDEEPHLFVDLNASPIVFSIRGLRYFGPRFRMLGVNVAQINTRDSFLRTHGAWLQLECSLLGEKIEYEANAERLPAEYSVLHAIWHGGLDEAERLCKRMDRRQASALRIVAGSTREPTGI
jgi:hypothetical protein